MTDNSKKKPGEGTGRRAKSQSSAPGEASEDGSTADVESVDDLISAEGPDVEVSVDADAPAADSPATEELTAEEISFLEDGERDLLDDMRNDLARAQAELVNFRKRVERDRAANRESVIAEVVRTLLPALDDLSRAEAHGDLAGSPLELVAQKLTAGFDRFGLKKVGEKGEPFDPHQHEAIVQLPNPEVTVNTVADVIEPGYALGERLIRAAKVAVFVPADS